MKDSLRICLSSYACEPNAGSEPGVGWAWALGMAKRHNTWVITRKNNRAKIESELQRRGIPQNERPAFIWVDLPEWVLFLKRHALIPIGLYYLLWQFKARNVWDKKGIKVDILQHVTFNSFVLPGVWRNREEATILGPLGGFSVCPTQYLRGYPLIARTKEWFRGKVRHSKILRYPFLAARRHADLIAFTTEEMREALGGNAKSVTELETAVPKALENSTYAGIDARQRDRQFVWAGTLAGHKGGEIAIRAFATAFGHVEDPPKLLMYGAGPDLKRLKRLSAETGIEKAVRFCGHVSQEYLWNAISRSVALFFTSVRDTSGNVALEAMALGTPVICFRHQGVAQIVDESCAILVEPSSWDDSITNFASALQKVMSNPSTALKLGQNGRKRALEKFTWDRKFDVVDSWYRELSANKDSN